MNIIKKGVDLRIDVENGPFSFQLGDALGPFQRIGLERSFGKEILSRKTQNNKTSDTTSTADQITFFGQKVNLETRDFKFSSESEMMSGKKAVLTARLIGSSMVA